MPYAPPAADAARRSASRSTTSTDAMLYIGFTCCNTFSSHAPHRHREPSSREPRSSRMAETDGRRRNGPTLRPPRREVPSICGKRIFLLLFLSPSLPLVTALKMYRQYRSRLSRDERPRSRAGGEGLRSGRAYTHTSPHARRDGSSLRPASAGPPLRRGPLRRTSRDFPTPQASAFSRCW